MTVQAIIQPGKSVYPLSDDGEHIRSVSQRMTLIDGEEDAQVVGDWGVVGVLVRLGGEDYLLPTPWAERMLQNLRDVPCLSRAEEMRKGARGR